MTFILLDIDHFKTLNDALGHSAGDNLLSFTGELLRASLRGTDIGVRYGGDEFAIIMLGASPLEGSALAQRVVSLFAQQSALLGTVPPVSMSAGVASVVTGRTCSAESLVRLADQALYRAKRKGRNTVQSVRA